MDKGIKALRNNARMVLDIIRGDIDSEYERMASRDRAEDLSNLLGKTSGVKLMLSGNYGVDDLITEIALLADEIYALQSANYASMCKVV